MDKIVEKVNWVLNAKTCSLADFYYILDGEGETRTHNFGLMRQGSSLRLSLHGKRYVQNQKIGKRVFTK
jgi:hypothetical protein